MTCSHYDPLQMKNENKATEEAIIEENIYSKISLITKAMTRYRLTTQISNGMKSLIPEMKQKHTCTKLNNNGTFIGLILFIQLYNRYQYENNINTLQSKIVVVQFRSRV